MQLHKGQKKAYPTYLAILREKAKKHVGDIHSYIIVIFEELKDVKWSNLHGKLSSKRKANHKIKLKQGAYSPASVPYYMAPPKL